MQDINRGLNRLGLSSIVDTVNGSNAARPSILKIEPPKSTSDQVNQIIAQAKDEVALEAQLNIHGTKYNDHDDKNDSDISDDDDLMLMNSDDDEETDDDDSHNNERHVLKHKKILCEKISKAQVKLAELMAMLEEHNACDDIDVNGLNSKQEIISFEEAHAKKTLLEAQSYVKKTLKIWDHHR